MVEIANTTREKPTVNIKNSSMNMAPNGRIPAISVLSTQTYQDNVAEETYTAQRQSLDQCKTQPAAFSNNHYVYANKITIKNNKKNANEMTKIVLALKSTQTPRA